MQHTLRSTLLLLLAVGFVSEAADASDVSYRKRWVQGVSANVVVANLNCPNVRVSPALAQRGVGTSEGFGSMLSRLQPAAAITGTFFCTNSLVPVGDLVIGGSVLSFGSVGTAICFTADNQVHFRRTRDGQAVNWAGYASVICGGPRIVRAGTAAVNPTAEGFRDPALFRLAPRAAIGVTSHNKLLLVTVNKPIYLSHMGRIMKDLGAVDAINLDGGSSTALFCKGTVPSHPGRRLTNLVLVYDSVAKFERTKPVFCPNLDRVGKPTGATTQSKAEDSRPGQSILRWMTEHQAAAPDGGVLLKLGIGGEKETTSEWETSLSHSDPLLLVPVTGHPPANEEAAANENGLLPRRAFDNPGLSRRTSSAWPDRTSSSYSHGKTSLPY